MLLAAISFWAGGSRWADPLLYRLMPKGIVAILILLAIILVIVSIHEPVLGIAPAVYFATAFTVLTAILVRKFLHGDGNRK